MRDMLRISAAGAVALALFACGGEPTKPGASEGDTTPPTLIKTNPGATAINVDVATPIAVEFSETMDAASVRLSVTPSIAFSAQSWGFGDTVLTLTPAAPLAWATSFTITVNGKDLAGNAMAEASFTFTTGPKPDLTPPSIGSTVPAAGATGVTTDTHVSITFSRPMDTATVTVNADPAYDFGAPKWDPESVTVTFDAPLATLTTSTTYAITVGGKDTGGRDLTGTTSFSFTTAAPPDTEPPSVINTAPSNGAATVPVSTSLSFTFSEPMNKATVEAAFSATPAINCTFLWDATATLMTCDPVADLTYSTPYAVTIGTGAKDAAGNAMSAAHSVSFTTAAAPDTTPPTIVSVSPADLSIGVERATNIVVTFSEPMDKASAQAAFAITSPTGFSGGIFTWDSTGTVMTYDPPGSFSYGALVGWQLSTTAQDLAGNALAATATRSFRVIRSATVTLEASPALDGSVSTTNLVNTTNGTLMVGDYSATWGINKYGSRSFVTFDLSSLTASGLTTITSATLYLYQSGVVGAPYGTTSLGNVVAESVDYGLSLEAADFSTLNLGYTYTLSTTNTTGLKIATVTNKVANDWTNRGARGNRSQFRLRFDVRDQNTNNSSDYVSFYSAEDATSYNRPRLSITYEYP